ncbi:MAG TPA: serine hydrolase [Steroidobacteraceae bacterium]|jgi:CubicO group peptidase (beta-lactamase class C family)|nr:serine hydrolase [Steroidobacteraceae bacterium]
MNVRNIMALAACAAAVFFQPSAARSATAAAVPDAVPAPPAASGSNGHLLDRGDLEAWLDGMVPYALKAGDMAGAVIVVVKDGNVLLQKGFGFADVSKKLRMDPEQTMVRIGSTSKLFTWTAVMQLVEKGQLDLDRDINDYLDFTIPKDFGKPVTLRDLMNHRGGFEEGLKDILWTNPQGVPSTEAYLKEHKRPMLFPPGEVPAYSNYGAALAGYIVERISKEPYERYIERHILVPLGMMHTSFDQPLPGRFAAAVSKGYRTASAPPGPYELIVTRPAGSGTTTAADMSRFLIAHLQDGHFGDAEILQVETAQRMHSPSESAPPGFAAMAHGFFREVKNGRTVLGHGGDSIYFHNEFELLPKEGVGIEFNFNSRGRESAVYLAREALFDGFMDRYFPEAAAPVDPPALPTAPADAQKIAGRYESSRRVEHGFLTLFYVLQQSVIAANPDGTISVPGTLTPEPVIYREIGPQLWRRAGGSQQLMLQTISGVKTVVDSGDPTSVLQAVPLRRSSALNLTVLIVTCLILVWTLLAWLLSPWLRAPKNIPDELVPQVRRWRLLLRAAAAFDALYLVCWFIILKPTLNLELDFYSSGLDPIVGAIQVAGLLAIAAAVLGIWSAWRLSRLNIPRRLRVWGFVTAVSLLGVAWIGIIGGLIRFSLNY